MAGTDIFFVTLDSLRHDVAHRDLQEGRTPRLAGLLPGGQWQRQQTPGTFTLPVQWRSCPASCPNPPGPPVGVPPTAFKKVPPETFVFDAPNLLDGLALHGYRTVCVGGVTYFSQETPLGSVLPAMFHEAHWQPEFCSPEPDSTRHQTDQALALADHYDGHISATHVPHGHYLGNSTDNGASQAAALAYTDAHLGRLLDGLSAHGQWLVIMCADHGDAYGDDGFYGRGIAHPAVWNVPFAAWCTTDHYARSV
ncbi:STM4013/SEN3800 family hydrolase [Streptomyces sp. NPDC005281]|uniref:STM4013/SEN3800 family hydrolase n=1 Tax=Streptomyces sp. NPDC005281 TaxID=3155712 RepID=UPI0033BEC671